MLHTEDGLNCEEISNINGIRVQKICNSYQIQGDLVTSYKGMFDAALAATKIMYLVK
jgi:hypothetical protein